MATAGGTDLLLAILFALLLFLIPLIPDVRLSRPKLLLTESGLALLAFLYLVRGFLSGVLAVRRMFLTVPALVYLAAMLLFYLLSPERALALPEFKRSLFSCGALFLAAHVCVTARGRLIVLSGLAAGSLLAALYGILQHTGGIGRIAVPAMTRAASTFGNPIFFAAFLAAVLPLLAGLLLYIRKPALKFCIAAVIIVDLFALIHTQTRAAFIAVAAAALAFGFMLLRTKRGKILLAAAVLTIFGISVMATRQIWSRPQAHLLIWRDSLVLWEKYPIFGTGPGTFHVSFPQAASDELKKIWPQGRFIVNDAHNEYIQFLVETGIIGFGILLWLFAAYFRGAAALLARASPPDRALLAGLTASAAAILTQNLFSVDMRFIISSVMLFFVMGVTASFAGTVRTLVFPQPLLRAAGAAAVITLSLPSFAVILQPYRAQRAVAATPDFFDVKILEPLKTISDLEAAARAHPNEARVFEKLGWVYAKEKNFTAAIASYERAAALAPSLPGPLNNMGNIYFLAGDRQKAIDLWNRSIALDPRQIDSRLNLATAYYYEGKLREAVAQIDAVLKIDAGNVKAVVLLKQMKE